MQSTMFMQWFSILLIIYLNKSLAKKQFPEEQSFSNSNSNFMLPLEHAFGVDDTFSPRGTIHVKTNRLGTTASLRQELSLHESEEEKLASLVENDGLYFVRTPCKIQTTDEPTNNECYVSTFVPVCHLIGSGMQESITIATDSDGNVLSTNVVSPSTLCKRTLDDFDLSRPFNTTIRLHQQVPGAVPDTHSFIKKMEEEKEETASGKNADNKSFFGKYWMYILPVFLILMLSSQAEPPSEGGGE